MGESASHKKLKELALSWARSQGYVIAAPEVSFPHRRFRFDVAACVPTRRAPARKATPITSILKAAVVFECKQGRGDLLKDNKRREAGKLRLTELIARKAKLESSSKSTFRISRKGKASFLSSIPTVSRITNTRDTARRSEPSASFRTAYGAL